jgi:uncharacterized repeat protein (TIGR02543 family)
MKYIKWLLCLILLFFIMSGCSKQVKVEFDTGTAASIEPLLVQKGDVLTDLPEPSQTGYDFKGWFLDEEFEEAYTDQPVNKSMVLYAKWEIKKFTVVFKSGNLEIHTVTVDYGTAATPPAENPSRIGHTFTGWDKEFDNVTSNLVVNAVFEPNVYTVTFKDGDTVLKTENVEFNTAATAPTPPEKTGYTFAGWDKEFDAVTSNLVVNAVYEPIYFTVTFKDDNGVVIETQNVQYGTAATPPADPVKNGYVFTGWEGDFSEVLSDLEIIATFELATYTITYYDEGMEIEHEPATYTILTGAELTAYEKDGLEFIGWYDNPEHSGTPITNLPIGTTGDVTLYGLWVTYSLISYELNGGSWYFTANSVTNASNGIDAFSNLPEILMIEIYVYLKDNDLLTSSIVASNLHKTTWADFSKNYTDPVAIYNHTTSNTAQTNDGYSQFFFDSATGNDTTGELLTISGGFFGTEPYKSKYRHLMQLISLMVKIRYPSSPMWGGASGKTLAGFVLDGYLYGTQSITNDLFGLMRKTIPQPNKGYRLVNNQLVPFDVQYPVTKHLSNQKTYLPLPHKEGYAFGGWYANSDFSGDRVYFLNPEDSGTKFYAKWIPINEY